MDKDVLFELDQVLNEYPVLESCRNAIIEAYNLLIDCYGRKGFVMTCGNGGSCSDSFHIVGELMKGFNMKRSLSAEHIRLIEKAFPGEGEILGSRLQRALPSISLASEPALLTAFANDVSSEMIFAQQVYGYGRKGDVLIAISTSGNSLNVVNACKIARSFGIRTIGFTGKNGGKMADICDVVIKAPETRTARIQEKHLCLYHALCAMIEVALMG